MLLTCLYCTDVENVKNILRALCAQVTASGGCEQEVKTRIGIAKKVMRNLDKIWRSHNISIVLKKRLVHALVLYNLCVRDVGLNGRPAKKTRGL